MNRQDFLEGFDFDDDQIIHEQIKAISFVESNGFVGNGHRNLPGNQQTPLPQFIC